MKGTELLRLVWLNVNQNKFKTIMTSIGIVVGAATIVMVIAIGRGSRMDVAEQFSSLNAGAIDISYEWEGEETSTGGGGFSFGDIFGNLAGRFGNFGGDASPDSGNEAMGGGFPGGMMGGNFPGGNSMGGGTTDGESMRGGFPGSDAGDGTTDGESMRGGFSGGDAGDGTTDGESMRGGFPGSDAGDDLSAGGEDRARNGESAAGGEAGAQAGESAAGDEDGAQDGESAGNGEAGAQDDSGEDAEAQTEEASIVDDRMNQENIILSAEDVDDIETYVPGISGATISYTTRSAVEGGNLTESQTYTIAGVESSYETVSNLEMAAGEFLTDGDNERKDRVCVLGASVAKELFGSASEAYDSSLYIDDREYVVGGVLETTGTVSAGISPDEAIFIPYATGIKYITGENISPVITVISEDVNAVDTVKENVDIVLKENYSNAEFTYSDTGSKIEAAESSNEILTMLLSAMAAIVFIVGGIGIMNVLFVSVKERTNEIGILKALGASRSTILFEFLIESATISLIGGVLGVCISFAITPVVEYYGMRVEANALAWSAALGFAVLTGTLFGFYPAWKASQLVPVEALNAE